MSYPESDLIKMKEARRICKVNRDKLRNRIDTVDRAEYSLNEAEVFIFEEYNEAECFRDVKKILSEYSCGDADSHFSYGVDIINLTKKNSKALQFINNIKSFDGDRIIYKKYVDWSFKGLKRL